VKPLIRDDDARLAWARIVSTSSTARRVLTGTITAPALWMPAYAVIHCRQWSLSMYSATRSCFPTP
jgi:hypothetical protein